MRRHHDLLSSQCLSERTRRNDGLLSSQYQNDTTHDRTTRRQPCLQEQTRPGERTRRHDCLLGGRYYGQERCKRWLCERRCKSWRCEKRQRAVYKERSSPGLYLIRITIRTIRTVHPRRRISPLRINIYIISLHAPTLLRNRLLDSPPTRPGFTPGLARWP